MRSRLIALTLMAVFGLICCRSKKPDDGRTSHRRLHDFASKARERGSLEEYVPYGFDEEEGTNLIVPSLDDALSNYEWVMGEPIEEKTIAMDEGGIYTVYRFRIEQRAGKSQQRHSEDEWVKKIQGTMTLREGEIFIIKSGGNIVVDGVLLKKRGELCFSELMPRRYLLGIRVSSSGLVGSLPLGCTSIFTVSGDQLTPRQSGDDPVTRGVREHLGNSLSAFLGAVEKHQQQ